MSELCLCCRLEEFVEWMTGVDESVEELERESMSTQQYRDTIERFQVNGCSLVFN